MSAIEQYVNNLRVIIARIIANYETRTTSYDVLDALKISYPTETNGLGKASFLQTVTASAEEKTIIDAAKQIIKSYPGRGNLQADYIYEIQNNIWRIENNGISEISKVSRYKIIEALEKIPFWGRLRLLEFFSPLLPSTVNGYDGIVKGKEGYIYKGFSGNTALFSGLFSGVEIKPTLISTAEFFREIGIDTWPDQRLILILERMVHPAIQPTDLQEKLVSVFNRLLKQENFELKKVGSEGGSPIYRVRKLGEGVRGTPKYIIFASSGVKPEIVISDTINMDIQVVKHADKCLIYDQTSPDGDLTWEMLLNWWVNKQGMKEANDKIRQEFGKRLRASLQSDPERIFFDTYFKIIKPKYGVNLPALVPQVYLHYDPRNQKEREAPVLVRQRMDFLLLLRNSARIVLEIDGMQHYADSDGKASSIKYAEMVSEDRRIRLLGYKIYRFGVGEIKNNDQYTQQIISSFFDGLFERHKILTP